jgi:hydrogenase-4 component F
MILLILLGVNLGAAILLAFIGDRKRAPELNIICSGATFAASVFLALSVYEKGPMTSGNDFFFVDAFNVYLAVLTAFVSMTTAIFNRRYMRVERSRARWGEGMRFTTPCTSSLSSPLRPYEQCRVPG